jgi:hypothetical protein
MRALRPRNLVTTFLAISTPLGDGQWDIPELRLLLEEVAPQRAAMEASEVERNFSTIVPLDALECAGGVQSKKGSHADSPVLKMSLSGAPPNGR